MENKKQNQKTLPLNVQGYSLVIIRSAGDTTHNTFSHVFRKGEKNPIFGTSHNDKTTHGVILDWANKRLKEYLSGTEDKELLEMLKHII